MTKKRKPPPQVEPTEEHAVIFTVAELAARWRVSHHTVTAAIRAGRLQAFKPDQRVYRILESEVIRYERQNLAAAS